MSPVGGEFLTYSLGRVDIHHPSLRWDDEGGGDDGWGGMTRGPLTIYSYLPIIFVI